KDASMVKVKPRVHREEFEGEVTEVDLGYVGDVVRMEPQLIEILLKNGYLPVIAPISQGEDGEDYNVNADLFAGHLAGALQAAAFVAVTDVDGLMKDLDDPDSHIDVADAATIRSEIGRSIQGGMIPKVEACLTALSEGVGEACIVNGMKPGRLVAQLVTNNGSGTTIKEHL
ncbi:MAG: acetylglutamate kinase, partial [Bacteroidota bacterium]